MGRNSKKSKGRSPTSDQGLKEATSLASPSAKAAPSRPARTAKHKIRKFPAQQAVTSPTQDTESTKVKGAQRKDEQHPMPLGSSSSRDMNNKGDSSMAPSIKNPGKSTAIMNEPALTTSSLIETGVTPIPTTMSDSYDSSSSASSSETETNNQNSSDNLINTTITEEVQTQQSTHKLNVPEKDVKQEILAAGDCDTSTEKSEFQPRAGEDTSHGVTLINVEKSSTSLSARLHDEKHAEASEKLLKRESSPKTDGSNIDLQSSTMYDSNREPQVFQHEQGSNIKETSDDRTDKHGENFQIAEQSEKVTSTNNTSKSPEIESDVSREHTAFDQQATGHCTMLENDQFTPVYQDQVNKDAPAEEREEHTQEVTEPQACKGESLEQPATSSSNIPVTSAQSEKEVDEPTPTGTVEHNIEKFELRNRQLEDSALMETIQWHDKGPAQLDISDGYTKHAIKSTESKETSHMEELGASETIMDSEVSQGKEFKDNKKDNISDLIESTMTRPADVEEGHVESDVLNEYKDIKDNEPNLVSMNGADEDHRRLECEVRKLEMEKPVAVVPDSQQCTSVESVVERAPAIEDCREEASEQADNTFSYKIDDGSSIEIQKKEADDNGPGIEGPEGKKHEHGKLEFNNAVLDKKDYPKEKPDQFCSDLDNYEHTTTEMCHIEKPYECPEFLKDQDREQGRSMEQLAEEHKQTHKQNELEGEGQEINAPPTEENPQQEEPNLDYASIVCNKAKDEEPAMSSKLVEREQLQKHDYAIDDFPICNENIGTDSLESTMDLEESFTDTATNEESCEEMTDERLHDSMHEECTRSHIKEEIINIEEAGECRKSRSCYEEVYPEEEMNQAHDRTVRHEYSTMETQENKMDVGKSEVVSTAQKEQECQEEEVGKQLHIDTICEVETTEARSTEGEKLDGESEARDTTLNTEEGQQIESAHHGSSLCLQVSDTHQPENEPGVRGVQKGSLTIHNDCESTQGTFYPELDRGATSEQHHLHSDEIEKQKLEVEEAGAKTILSDEKSQYLQEQTTHSQDICGAGQVLPAIMESGLDKPTHQVPESDLIILRADPCLTSNNTLIEENVTDTLEDAKKIDSQVEIDDLDKDWVYLEEKSEQAEITSVCKCQIDSVTINEHEEYQIVDKNIGDMSATTLELQNLETKPIIEQKEFLEQQIKSFSGSNLEQPMVTELEVDRIYIPEKSERERDMSLQIDQDHMQSADTGKFDQFQIRGQEVQGNALQCSTVQQHGSVSTEPTLEEPTVNSLIAEVKSEEGSLEHPTATDTAVERIPVAEKKEEQEDKSQRAVEGILWSATADNTHLIGMGEPQVENIKVHEDNGGCTSELQQLESHIVYKENENQSADTSLDNEVATASEIAKQTENACQANKLDHIDRGITCEIIGSISAANELKLQESALPMLEPHEESRDKVSPDKDEFKDCNIQKNTLYDHASEYPCERKTCVQTETEKLEIVEPETNNLIENKGSLKQQAESSSGNGLEQPITTQPELETIPLTEREEEQEKTTQIDQGYIQSAEVEKMDVNETERTESENSAFFMESESQDNGLEQLESTIINTENENISSVKTASSLDVPTSDACPDKKEPQDEKHHQDDTFECQTENESQEHKFILNDTSTINNESSSVENQHRLEELTVNTTTTDEDLHMEEERHQESNEACLQESIVSSTSLEKDEAKEDSVQHDILHVENCSAYKDHKEFYLENVSYKQHTSSSSATEVCIEERGINSIIPDNKEPEEESVHNVTTDGEERQNLNQQTENSRGTESEQPTEKELEQERKPLTETEEEQEEITHQIDEGGVKLEEAERIDDFITEELDAENIALREKESHKDELEQLQSDIICAEKENTAVEIKLDLDMPTVSDNSPAKKDSKGKEADATHQEEKESQANKHDSSPFETEIEGYECSNTDESIVSDSHNTDSAESHAGNLQGVDQEVKNNVQYIERCIQQEPETIRTKSVSEEHLRTVLEDLKTEFEKGEPQIEEETLDRAQKYSDETDKQHDFCTQQNLNQIGSDTECQAHIQNSDENEKYTESQDHMQNFEICTVNSTGPDEEEPKEEENNQAETSDGNIIGKGNEITFGQTHENLGEPSANIVASVEGSTKERQCANSTLSEDTVNQGNRADQIDLVKSSAASELTLQEPTKNSVDLEEDSMQEKPHEDDDGCVCQEEQRTNLSRTEMDEHDGKDSQVAGGILDKINEHQGEMPENQLDKSNVTDEHNADPDGCPTKDLKGEDQEVKNNVQDIERCIQQESEIPETVPTRSVSEGQRADLEDLTAKFEKGTPQVEGDTLAQEQKSSEEIPEQEDAVTQIKASVEYKMENFESKEEEKGNTVSENDCVQEPEYNDVNSVSCDRDVMETGDPSTETEIPETVPTRSVSEGQRADLEDLTAKFEKGTPHVEGDTLAQEQKSSEEIPEQEDAVTQIKASVEYKMEKFESKEEEKGNTVRENDCVQEPEYNDVNSASCDRDVMETGDPSAETFAPHKTCQEGLLEKPDEDTAVEEHTADTIANAIVKLDEEELEVNEIQQKRELQLETEPEQANAALDLHDNTVTETTENETETPDVEELLIEVNIENDTKVLEVKGSGSESTELDTQDCKLQSEAFQTEQQTRDVLESMKDVLDAEDETVEEHDSCTPENTNQSGTDAECQAHKPNSDENERYTECQDHAQNSEVRTVHSTASDQEVTEEEHNNQEESLYGNIVSEGTEATFAETHQNLGEPSGNIIASEEGSIKETQCADSAVREDTIHQESRVDQIGLGTACEENDKSCVASELTLQEQTKHSIDLEEESEQEKIHEDDDGSVCQTEQRTNVSEIDEYFKKDPQVTVVNLDEGNEYQTEKPDQEVKDNVQDIEICIQQEPETPETFPTRSVSEEHLRTVLEDSTTKFENGKPQVADDTLDTEQQYLEEIPEQKQVAATQSEIERREEEKGNILGENKCLQETEYTDIISSSCDKDVMETGDPSVETVTLYENCQGGLHQQLDEDTAFEENMTNTIENVTLKLDKDELEVNKIQQDREVDLQIEPEQAHAELVFHENTVTEIAVDETEKLNVEELFVSVTNTESDVKIGEVQGSASEITEGGEEDCKDEAFCTEQQTRNSLESMKYELEAKDLTVQKHDLCTQENVNQVGTDTEFQVHEQSADENETSTKCQAHIQSSVENERDAECQDHAQKPEEFTTNSSARDEEESKEEENNQEDSLNKSIISKETESTFAETDQNLGKPSSDIVQPEEEGSIKEKQCADSVLGEGTAHQESRPDQIDLSIVHEESKEEKSNQEENLIRNIVSKETETTFAETDQNLGEPSGDMIASEEEGSIKEKQYTDGVDRIDLSIVCEEESKEEESNQGMSLNRNIASKEIALTETGQKLGELSADIVTSEEDGFIKEKQCSDSIMSEGTAHRGNSDDQIDLSIVCEEESKEEESNQDERLERSFISTETDQYIAEPSVDIPAFEEEGSFREKQFSHSVLSEGTAHKESTAGQTDLSIVCEEESKEESSQEEGLSRNVVSEETQTDQNLGKPSADIVAFEEDGSIKEKQCTDSVVSQGTAHQESRADEIDLSMEEESSQEESLNRNIVSEETGTDQNLGEPSVDIIASEEEESIKEKPCTDSVVSEGSGTAHQETRADQIDMSIVCEESSREEESNQSLNRNTVSKETETTFAEIDQNLGEPSADIAASEEEGLVKEKQDIDSALSEGTAHQESRTDQIDLSIVCEENSKIEKSNQEEILDRNIVREEAETTFETDQSFGEPSANIVASEEEGSIEKQCADGVVNEDTVHLQNGQDQIDLSIACEEDKKSCTASEHNLREPIEHGINLAEESVQEKIHEDDDAGASQEEQRISLLKSEVDTHGAGDPQVIDVITDKDKCQGGEPDRHTDKSIVLDADPAECIAGNLQEDHEVKDNIHDFQRCIQQEPECISISSVSDEHLRTILENSVTKIEKGEPQVGEDILDKEQKCSEEILEQNQDERTQIGDLERKEECTGEMVDDEECVQEPGSTSHDENVVQIEDPMVETVTVHKSCQEVHQQIDADTPCKGHTTNTIENENAKPDEEDLEVDEIQQEREINVQTEPEQAHVKLVFCEDTVDEPTENETGKLDVETPCVTSIKEQEIHIHENCQQLLHAGKETTETSIENLFGREGSVPESTDLDTEDSKVQSDDFCTEEETRNAIGAMKHDLDTNDEIVEEHDVCTQEHLNLEVDTDGQEHKQSPDENQEISMSVETGEEQLEADGSGAESITMQEKQEDQVHMMVQIHGMKTETTQQEDDKVGDHVENWSRQAELNQMQTRNDDIEQSDYHTEKDIKELNIGKPPTESIIYDIATHEDSNIQNDVESNIKTQHDSDYLDEPNMGKKGVAQVIGGEIEGAQEEDDDNVLEGYKQTGSTSESEKLELEIKELEAECATVEPYQSHEVPPCQKEPLVELKEEEQQGKIDNTEEEKPCQEHYLSSIQKEYEPHTSTIESNQENLRMRELDAKNVEIDTMNTQKGPCQINDDPEKLLENPSDKLQLAEPECNVNLSKVDHFEDCGEQVTRSIEDEIKREAAEIKITGYSDEKLDQSDNSPTYVQQATTPAEYEIQTPEVKDPVLHLVLSNIEEQQKPDEDWHGNECEQSIKVCENDSPDLFDINFDNKEQKICYTERASKEQSGEVQEGIFLDERKDEHNEECDQMQSTTALEENAHGSLDDAMNKLEVKHQEPAATEASEKRKDSQDYVSDSIDKMNMHEIDNLDAIRLEESEERDKTPDGLENEKDTEIRISELIMLNKLEVDDALLEQNKEYKPEDNDHGPVESSRHIDRNNIADSEENQAVELGMEVPDISHYEGKMPGIKIPEKAVAECTAVEEGEKCQEGYANSDDNGHATKDNIAESAKNEREEPLDEWGKQDTDAQASEPTILKKPGFEAISFEQNEECGQERDDCGQIEHIGILERKSTAESAEIEADEPKRMELPNVEQCETKTPAVVIQEKSEREYIMTEENGETRDESDQVECGKLEGEMQIMEHVVDEPRKYEVERSTAQLDNVLAETGSQEGKPENRSDTQVDEIMESEANKHESGGIYEEKRCLAGITDIGDGEKQEFKVLQTEAVTPDKIESQKENLAIDELISYTPADTTNTNPPLIDETEHHPEKPEKILSDNAKEMVGKFPAEAEVIIVAEARPQPEAEAKQVEAAQQPLMKN